MTSVFTVKMDDHYGNNKCNVEKNVPVAFILTRRWQDGAEILGTETWRCLSQTSRSKHYLKCGLVVVKWSTCSPSTRTVWVQFPPKAEDTLRYYLFEIDQFFLIYLITIPVVFKFSNKWGGSTVRPWLKKRLEEAPLISSQSRDRNVCSSFSSAPTTVQMCISMTTPDGCFPLFSL